MKKITISLIVVSLFLLTFGFAALAEETASTAKPALDPALIQAAIDKRDTAIIAAVDVYSTAVKQALETRKTELKTAWGITVVKDRKTAIKKAWKNYGAAIAKARKDFKNAKKAAWKQFNTDRKASKVPNVDSTSESVDNSL